MTPTQIYNTSYYRSINEVSSYKAGRISVIIPTYNYGQFLNATLKSVFDQIATDVEVIVVDDGSCDTTFEIIQPFKSKICYIYQKNSGLSSARNTGLMNCTGEFIKLLDADDILGPQTLSFQLEFMRKNPDVSISVCKSKLFHKTDLHGNPRPSGYWSLFREHLDTHLCFYNIAPPHAYFFRRQVFLKTGWFDPELAACEDYDYWLRSAVNGFIPRFNPSGFVYYRRHPNSMSSNLLNQYYYDAILHQRLSRILSQNPDFPIGQRLDGLLAFTAGALITAVRLYSINAEKSAELLNLAEERIDESLLFSVKTKIPVGLSLLYYSMKCLSQMVFPSIRESPRFRRIRNKLHILLCNLNAPKSETRLLLSVFSLSLLNKNLSPSERWKVVCSALSYLTNFVTNKDKLRKQTYSNKSVFNEQGKSIL